MSSERTVCIIFLHGNFNTSNFKIHLKIAALFWETYTIIALWIFLSLLITVRLLWKELESHQQFASEKQMRKVYFLFVQRFKHQAVYE